MQSEIAVATEPCLRTAVEAKQPAAPIARNAAGDVVYFDGGKWVPAKTAINPSTGEVFAFNGKDWVPVKPLAPAPATAGGNNLPPIPPGYRLERPQ